MTPILLHVVAKFTTQYAEFVIVASEFIALLLILYRAHRSLVVIFVVNCSSFPPFTVYSWTEVYNKTTKSCRAIYPSMLIPFLAPAARQTPDYATLPVCFDTSLPSIFLAVYICKTFNTEQTCFAMEVHSCVRIKL